MRVTNAIATFFLCHKMNKYFDSHCSYKFNFKERGYLVDGQWMFQGLITGVIWNGCFKNVQENSFCLFFSNGTNLISRWLLIFLQWIHSCEDGKERAMKNKILFLDCCHNLFSLKIPNKHFLSCYSYSLWGE